MDFDFSLDSLTNVMKRVKNAVLQLSEMEVKVLDATNNEPWGASSTLMQEIANGTHNFSHFNEIMTTIYKRLAERPGPEWRKVYKALQLLEYLLKNGSEQVIDAARSHMYELKALSNFAYVDEKNKDQGINVRMRAKEIIDLLGDTEKIKEERRKARENKSKYQGVSSASVSSFGGASSGGRFGGFGSNSFQVSSSTSYSGGFKDDYQSQDSSFQTTVKPSSKEELSFESFKKKPSDIPPVQEVAKPVEANLLDFGEEIAPVKTNASKETDDWGDFAEAQSATETMSPSIPPPVPSFVNVPPPLSTTNTLNAKPVNAFADFKAFTPVSSVPFTSTTSANNTSSTNTIPKAQFADFSKQNLNTTSTTSSDPFSKLVSLDANSLSSSFVRKDSAGPTLNEMNQNKLNQLNDAIWNK